MTKIRRSRSRSVRSTRRGLALHREQVKVPILDSDPATGRARLRRPGGERRPQGADAELAPLHRHRVLDTSDVSVAQRVGTQLMSSNRVRLGRRPRFRCHVSAATLAGCTLLGADFRGGDPIITADEPMDYYTLFVLLTGAVTVSGSLGDFGVAANQMFVCSPAETVRMHLTDTAFLALKVPRAAIATQYASLTGRALEGHLAFAPFVANSSASSPMRELLLVASRTVERYAGQSLSIGLAGGLRNSLLTTLLISQPSTHTRHLLQPEGAAHHDAIHAAAEIMLIDHDHLGVAQVAAKVGLSVRALQIGFRRVYGVTPSQFQRDAWLDRVHHRLLEADPDTEVTVAAIAHECGFTHLGRFSAAYRRRFGVLPSTTLRLL